MPNIYQLDSTIRTMFSPETPAVNPIVTETRVEGPVGRCVHRDIWAESAGTKALAGRGSADFD